jgi:mono/diheme cytochrome c family protein
MTLGRLTQVSKVRYVFPMCRLACLTFAALLAIMGLPWAPPAFANAKQIARGHAIAREYCGRCHAIGISGESTDPRSPPFRTLSGKYPLSDLEEALSEGIMVGHQGPEMPQFQLDPDQISALLAYLASIQAK